MLLNTTLVADFIEGVLPLDLTFVSQSNSCPSSSRPSSKNGQPVPDKPDDHHRPQSNAAGRSADATDAGYGVMLHTYQAFLGRPRMR